MKELKDLDRQLLLFRIRAWSAGILVLVAFGLLVARMTVLQIQRHDNYVRQAENNRTAVLPIVPTRGQIVDRNGVVLADNESAYTVEIIPSETSNLEETIAAIGQIVPVSARDIRRFRRLLSESKRFDSIPLRARLKDEEVALLAGQLYRLPGVEIQARLLRNYPLGETGSHLLGYIGRINQREKEQIEDWPDEQQANYRGTEYIGKLGIEQYYEELLHGTTGFERVETSAGGRAIRTLTVTPPVNGQQLGLTIDIKLQHLVEDLFGERRGALVALNPQNGEVLALVSKPTFDPNLFVEGIDVENWKALNESPDKPLLNRALRGTYPPGSTYKPFMALAALETGARKAATGILDPGYWVLGDHKFRSHGDSALGMVNMRRSIVMSSNVYYYTLAYEMGVEAIHDFMEPIGFGQPTGIDLNGEARGILPNQAWKRKAYKRADQQRWHPGETVSLGIGQGYNNFTVLQLANATAVLANGGTRYPPRLRLWNRAVRGSSTEALVAEGQALGFKPENVATVIDAMEGVTLEGTSARVFAGAGYRSGGKTGTAQAVTIGQKDKYNASRMAESQRDHSLYIAFAPVENPTVAVGVIVENAGFGAAHAAPIARRVFDYLLMGQYPNADDIEATRKGLTAGPLGRPRKVVDVVWPPVAGAEADHATVNNEAPVAPQMRH